VALFDRRQMIDAELCEWVCLQPFRLDRVVAGRAEAERAGIHASQRGVDLLQQAAYFARSAQCGDRRLQLLAPVEQLITVKSRCIHEGTSAC
jgi:hypothetical protein